MASVCQGTARRARIRSVEGAGWESRTAPRHPLWGEGRQASSGAECRERFRNGPQDTAGNRRARDASTDSTWDRLADRAESTSKRTNATARDHAPARGRVGRGEHGHEPQRRQPEAPSAARPSSRRSCGPSDRARPGRRRVPPPRPPRSGGPAGAAGGRCPGQNHMPRPTRLRSHTGVSEKMPWWPIRAWKA